MVSTITSWATTATVRDAGSPLPLWWSPFLVVVVETVSFPSFFSNAGLPFSHHFQFLYSPSEIRVIKSNINQLDYTNKKKQETVDDNKSKIKLNKTLPYLVSNVVEILDPINDDEESEAGAAQQDEANGKSVVVKTTTRQTIYLPLPGLVDPDELKPGDLIGTNKDSYIILETLPTEYDSRVKAMEIDEKPQEEYQDIGGCEKQIEELIEAVVLPMREAERFIKIGIQPPKGVLLWGPPGTGKTLLARACAKHTDAVFLKLAGPELVSFLWW